LFSGIFSFLQLCLALFKALKASAKQPQSNRIEKQIGCRGKTQLAEENRNDNFFEFYY
jgi:hypothetical protein